MSYNLKDLYSPEFYQTFCTVANKVIADFDAKQFTRAIFDEQWEERELKDRMNHTARVLHRFLPEHFPAAAQVLVQLREQLEAEGITEAALEYMFLPACIERFGLDHFDAAVGAMERITPFTSCEFAVRPFYLKYPEQMLDKTQQWARHSNPHVRRLASEGCRPRLPWAMALPFLKEDPGPILPVLEMLKDDESEYVRRSVANNLNDICKDNPEVALQLATRWKGQNETVDRVVKHGIRTLLKQGQPEALQLFGFAPPVDLAIKNLRVHSSTIKIGEELVFSFELHNTARQTARVRLEYGMYFKRKNGHLSRKVFQISEKTYTGGSVTRVEKKHSFRRITTRVYYPGEQAVAVIVNGVEKGKLAFTLLK